MEVFLINTPQGLPLDQLHTEFEHLGKVHVVAQYENENQLKNAFPLTHVKLENEKAINPIALKVQHLAAWEQMIHREVSGAIVILDTVRFTTPVFAQNIEYNKPRDADLCIFSATNLRINGIWISGTDWALLHSEDPNFNNICNAYYVTLDGAKKLYARRNEMLNDATPFGPFINSVAHHLAMDRVITYMSMHPTSSKPIHIVREKT